jgi:hypothetical protein
MKKTTKTVKPSTPTAKSIAPAPAQKTAIAPAPAPKPAVAPKVKKPAASVKPSSITITANVDVGFGNSLYIRGTGAGLSWERGQLLQCVMDNAWTITLSGTDQPVSFKLLINDEKWSEGSDAIASPGDSVTLAPVF